MSRPINVERMRAEPAALTSTHSQRVRVSKTPCLLLAWSAGKMFMIALALLLMGGCGDAGSASKPTHPAARRMKRVVVEPAAATEEEASQADSLPYLSYDPPAEVTDTESLIAQANATHKLAEDLRQFREQFGTNNPFALSDKEIETLISNENVELQ